MARRKGARPNGAATTAIISPSPNTPPPSLEPFVPAPSKLLPFLKTLPPNHVYITSLDTTTPTIKRNAFLVPVFLNTLIALGLFYRIYCAAPTYFWLIVTVFGYDSPATIDLKTTPTSDLFGTVGGRTTLFMIDHAIFGLIGAWPWQFLFGNKEGGYVGPVTWRWTLGGFEDKEIVVRRSRRWDKSVFGEQAVKKSKKKAEKPILPLTMDEVLTVKLKVSPAMEEQYMKRTGYAMLDRDWDLDFAGMVNAFQLIRGRRLTTEDLENKAFMYNAKEKAWLTWTVHKPKSSTSIETGEKDPVVESFRERLAAMGHEELFYRWIELVQYESSVPGGMTEARQMKVLNEARKIFAEKGVDFDKFFNDVGGQAGMPGLES